MEFDLSGYLQKFQTLLPRETKVRNAVIEAVRETVGVSLERHKIAVSGSNVFIHGSSSLKSEISLKEVKIKRYIADRFPDLSIQQIR